jgi:hypothetical protein
LRTLVFTALAVVGVGLWASGPALKDSQIIVGYAARTTCSCLHVAQRSFESCMRDLPPAAGTQIKWTTTDDSVTAALLGGLVSARADFEEGYGCTFR